MGMHKKAREISDPGPVKAITEEALLEGLLLIP